MIVVFLYVLGIAGFASRGIHHMDALAEDM